MADMLHEIRVAASPKAVLDALSAQEGLRGWWTADSVAEPKLGTLAEFGFGNRAILFRMKIVKLTAEKIVWECLGDVEEWRGTSSIWNIQPAEGGTAVRFTHAGWKSVDGWFAPCNSTWGELMYRLRDYAEGKNLGPLFSGEA
jgi:uncharacterized protein YndB with AHSA1/START domain